MVVTPLYGDIAPGWGAGYYGGHRLGGLSVPLRTLKGTSLLQTNFNECLASALCCRDDGAATHIAMLHPDISPRCPWLDILYSDLWSTGAMLVSAVVPIKSDGANGATSTGIGLRSDPWRTIRVVRQQDRPNLPLCFGTEHVAQGPDEILLVNTGCWMADLRHPFWNWFIDEHRTPGGTSGFNVYSRIRKSQDGRYEVATRSEDWEMSHDLTTYGARYMATWRVTLTHRGHKEWANF